MPTPSRHAAQHLTETRQTRRAVVYARVSSKEQELGFSIDAQLRLLRDYAEKQDLEIIEQFIDVESAGTAGRTAFTAMLAHVSNKTDRPIILAEKTDRLLRNAEDDVTLRKLGVEIRFVKE